MSWSSLSTGSGLSTSSTDSMVEIIAKQDGLNASSPHESKDHHPHILLFSKSKVYVHPTAYARDNIPGFVALVKRDAINPVHFLAWIPESLLDEKGPAEWDKFTRVEEKADLQSKHTTEQDVVFVELPVSRPESYAFSVPLTSIYSLLVHKPSLSSWYGSIAIHLISGSTLPTLYFHDDETKSLSSGTASTPSPMQAHWGGDELISRLHALTNILRSQLQSNLYLVDPSKGDIETHTTPLFDDDAVDTILSRSPNSYSPVPSHLRPRPLTNNGSQERDSLLHRSLAAVSAYPPPSNTNPTSSLASSRMTFLQSFSSVTRATRHAAQTILSHPLAKPIVPHLPDPVKSLVNADGEWSSWVEKSGTGDYEGARVYLARWARVVAEEGERARIKESASMSASNEPAEEGNLGIFEVLQSASNLPTPKTTRQPSNPIGPEVWAAWFDQEGRGQVREEDMRREVFRRGLTYNMRRQVWPYLLGLMPWKATTAEREAQWNEKCGIYKRIKSQWDNPEVVQTEQTLEEIHRIDVDCRRTDRTHSMFAPSDESSASSYSHQTGAQSQSNPHIELLGQILLTYNLYEKNLGYVQGMSDLCAPVYVVMHGDEEMTFWCFVAIMDRMRQNFLRDQSGMKKQLLALQQLLGVMDPQLHQHLESTDGLNLFFCFRWILIAFKREFPFDEVLRLWDVLWTDFLSNDFVLFIALAILESHRDVILRYLVEFDEILKYCNELSMTIDLDSTLAQAEVLFLSFAQMVGDYDRRKVEREHLSAEGLRHRKPLAASSFPEQETAVVTEISPYLRDLLHAGKAGDVAQTDAS